MYHVGFLEQTKLNKNEATDRAKESVKFSRCDYIFQMGLSKINILASGIGYYSCQIKFLW